MKRFSTGKLINTVFVLIGAAIIFFLLYKLRGYVSEIDFKSLQFNYRYLAMSFLIIPVWFVLRCWVWKFLLKSMGEEISLINSIRLIGFTNFGKYIPGKVWFTVGRTVLAERLGIPKKKSFASIVWDTYFLLLISISFLALLIFRIQLTNRMVIPAVITVMCIIIPLSIPAVFKKLINILLRIIKKKSVEYSVPGRDVILILIMDLIIWSLQGLQFLLLIKSIYSPPLDYLTVMLLYPSAWAMGFIVLVMPAGLGIREGFLSFVLMQVFPPDMKGMAIIVAFLSRIQVTIGELSYLLTLIGSKRIWRFNEKAKY